MMIFLLPLLLLLFATVVDFRRHEVPDWIPIALLVWALVSYLAGWQSRGWVDLLAGFGLGSAIGLALFAFVGFGGGDAKLLAALGMVLGPIGFLRFLVYVAIAGGVIAAVAMARGKREIAYAPAIAFGFLMVMIARGVQ
jgi:prepilin peptidase CpaA